MAKVFIIGLFFSILLLGILINIPSIVIPFLASFCIAYILNPALNWLQNKTHFSRSILAISIVLIFTIIFTYSVILLVPLIYSQIAILIQKIPIYKDYATQNVVPYILEKLHKIDPQIAAASKNVINQSINSMFGVFMSMAHNIWSYTIATINAVVMLLLVPIIVFYLLRDWDKMSSNFYSLFPKKLQNFVKNIFSDINKVLSGYISGQLLVCIIWNIYYYIGLKLIGLDIAFILGIISGFSVMVPLIGPIAAISTSLIVGYFTFGISINLTYIAVLYLAGNIIDNSLITPKIIGDSIGLHPLWIMFSVLLLGFLEGPLGMLLAIPIAGVTSVIIKNLKNEYQKSKIYIA